jgi:serine protease AprX
MPTISSTRSTPRRAGALATAMALMAAAVVGSHSAPTAHRAALPAHRADSSFASSKWGDSLADAVSENNQGSNDADQDPGSLYTIENAIGARKVWAETDSHNRQITGQGVTVALLDSGTAPVAGLNDPGKVTYGPDLSIESNGVLTDQDTFGHGTHLAGIIAAHDPATLTSKTIPKLDSSVQLGVAPDADLLSMKLATTDGSTDVSQVIAALNWITEHQTSADGSAVRVVNLSFGTDSLQPYQLDPLAAAAENAWRHGLVVVVSGGNGGPDAGRLTDPAIDPYVIAVGASSGNDTVKGWQKPTVASFSSSGSATRHVDLLAPGKSIVSLRDPGSYVDVQHPEGLVDGDTTGRLFRGSGTSQAAAVVSGAVALLLQAHPELTPDQVKSLLVTTADPVAASAVDAGAGQIDIAAAMDAAKKSLVGTLLKIVLGGKTTNPVQSFPVSTGQGSLQAARGGDELVDADGNAIDGEIDVQGNAWDPVAWWAAASSLTSWDGGEWLGTVWTGDSWDPSSGGLQSSRWSSSRWSSSRWSDADWDSSRWSSSRWSSSRWSSSRWSDADWNGSRWSGEGW